jgi:Ser/Thr protein kinase RdoA (MazF antagonist)
MMKRAAPVWPVLLAAAGISPEGARIVRRIVKDTPTLEHLILHLRSDGRDAIFKQLYRPANPTHFAGIVAAQDAAARRLNDHPRAQVPAIMAVDAVAQAMLMDFAPGDTVQAVIENGAEPLPVLARAGKWMAAFHRDPAIEKRSFRPHFMADHLGHLAQQVKAGEKNVPARAEFLHHVATIRAMAPAFVNRAGVTSVRHGDLHTRNIILDGGMGYGIDFHPPGTAPVGFDIARFLLHYTEKLVSTDAMQPGHVVPAAALAAFFNGYDVIPPDDAAVTFLLRVRILTNWASFPPSRRVMSLMQLTRFAKLRAIARNALDGWDT